MTSLHMPNYILVIGERTGGSRRIRCKLCRGFLEMDEDRVYHCYSHSWGGRYREFHVECFKKEYFKRIEEAYLKLKRLTTGNLPYGTEMF